MEYLSWLPKKKYPEEQFEQNMCYMFFTPINSISDSVTIRDYAKLQRNAGSSFNNSK